MEFKCIGAAVLNIVLPVLLVDSYFPGRRGVHSHHSMYILCAYAILKILILKFVGGCSVGLNTDVTMGLQ